MCRWTAIDHCTQQPKMVSVCVQWAGRDQADSFSQVFEQAIKHLTKVEEKHRGEMPTYGAGDALLSRPKVSHIHFA